MTTPVSAQYAGARVTRLVNREAILADIKAAVEDSDRTHVFYIEATGGTGKTFLAREVLRLCREGDWASPDLVAATDEIDLYHQGARSREGFMDVFVQVLGEDTGAFEAYLKQRRHLQEVKYDLRGAIHELRREQRRLAQMFLDGCTALSKGKRIVISIDTVERLVYEPDRIQEALALGEDEFTMRRWLLREWLPHVQNAVILVSGRPRKDDRFANEIETIVAQHQEILFDTPELGDFRQSDTLAYFEAVEKTAAEDDNRAALDRLREISDERRRVIHHLTDGHPITLALVIDYYLVTGELLPEIKMSEAEIKALSDDKLDDIRDKIKADVARQFQQIGRPADEVIRALAWAPKGMTTELLSRVAGMEYEKADAILKALADRRRGLSFIKIRPADSKAFLHDEMYALMKEHGLDVLPEARAEQVYDQILEYYEEQIAALRDRVARLRAQRREERVTQDGRVILASDVGTPVAPSTFAGILDELDELEVERLYYQLRQDPLHGFEEYSERAMEAVTSNDTRQDMSLRDEMLTFVREAFGEDEAEVGGLRRDDVERHAAILWAWRNLYSAKPGEARAIASHLRTEEADFVSAGGILVETELNVIEGWAAAFLGENLEATETRLRSAIDTLSHLQTELEFDEKRRLLLLARAHNILGYLLRVQGRFRSACKAYRPALPLWRTLRREADHAETLNNLAWANAEAGNLGRAMRRCQDGMELREQIGYRYLIALSYNTLGLIEIRADQPHRGRVHCERALAIFRELEVARGAGLAWTALAEAYRRCAATPRTYLMPEKIELLRLARDFATQAVEVFRDVPERLRLVEALNELGCVCRDWSHLRHDYRDEAGPNREDLAEMGRQALEEAAKRAADAFPYRRMDALVNLAWLYFYVDEPGMAIEVLSQAEESVPPDYRFLFGSGMPPVPDPVAFFWVLLGKSHLLQGMIDLQTYNRLPAARDSIRDERRWRRVAEHFTLSLAYNELFADDSREMRRAKDTMYDSLSGANLQEIKGLYEGMRQAAKAYRMEYKEAERGSRAEPRMRNFLEEYFGNLEEIQAGTI